MRRSARLQIQGRLSDISDAVVNVNDGVSGSRPTISNANSDDDTVETSRTKLRHNLRSVGTYKKPLYNDNTKPASRKHFKIDQSLKSTEAANNDDSNDYDSIFNNDSVDSEVLQTENTTNTDFKVDANGIMNYQKLREANLKANQELFARLGFGDIKTNMNDSKRKPSQRGLILKKELKLKNTDVDVRRSLRIKRIDPLGAPIPDPVPVVSNSLECRLPSGPVTFMDALYLNKKELSESDKEICLFHSLMSKVKGRSAQRSQSYSLNNFLAKLHKADITERLVAKVVPGRVFSLTWHPSPEMMISIAGDKYGHIGFWNVLEKENNELVTVFKPHTKPVSHLAVSPFMAQKLYSCSYDATLRCGDFEKGVFDEIFSLPEENDDLFRNFDFVDSHNTMLVAQYSGNVSFIDTRTPTTTAEHVYQVSRKSLCSVSVNPAKPHYFMTAGIDTIINLWDLRYLRPKSPEPIESLHKHSKSVGSAYFSPRGNSILSSSADNTIMVYDISEDMKVDLKKCIRHNNHTGRWLTRFQPQWHPNVDGIFVSGSMNHPREIEVFDSQGTKLRSLTNADHLSSVCSLNVFHPNMICTLVGANASGRLFVFM